MPTRPVHCFMRQTYVNVATDRAGVITRVFCPEQERATGSCRLKMTAAMRYMRTPRFESVAQSTKDSEAIRCDLVGRHILN